MQSSTAFLAAQSGFLSRRLLRDQQGWIDLVEWEDMVSAMVAAQSFLTAPGTSEFVAAIDAESVSMRHYHLLVSA